MINNMMRKRSKQGGFSFAELMIALLIVIVLMAVVILATQGFFTKARGTTMQGDIHTVKNAVDDYYLASSGSAPTANGSLPPTGQYATIDFYASFDDGGKTMSFYPNFLAKLPRHSGEGVWRIDNAGLVSIDMAPDKY